MSQFMEAAEQCDCIWADFALVVGNHLFAGVPSDGHNHHHHHDGSRQRWIRSRLGRQGKGQLNLVWHHLRVGPTLMILFGRLLRSANTPNKN